MSTTVRWLVTGAVVLVALVGVALVAGLAIRPRPEALDRHALAAPAEAPRGLQIELLGNTNVLVSDGTTHILTDGFFSRPGMVSVLYGKIAPDPERIASALERAGITQLDLVVPVHDHYDHAMDAPLVAQRTGARLLGSESTRNIARGLGFDETRFELERFGEPVQIGALTVTVLKSRHWQYPDPALRAALLDQPILEPIVPPARAFDYKEGSSVTILIEGGGVTIGIQGSAGYVPGALDGRHVDLLFLGIGGIETNSEEETDRWWRQVVDALDPSVIVPIHWDDFLVPLGSTLEPPNLLTRLVTGADLGAAFDALESRAGGRRIVVLPPFVPFGVEALLAR